MPGNNLGLYYRLDTGCYAGTGSLEYPNFTRELYPKDKFSRNTFNFPCPALSIAQVFRRLP